MNPHPLFPEAKPDAEIGHIHVTRFDPAKGRFVYAVRCWPAAELLDVGQIWQAYGGGSYELVARTEDRRRISARAQYELDGDPKPLEPSAPKPKLDATPMPQSVPSPDTGMAAMIPLLMQMMQAQSQQTTQILLAVLQRGESSGREHIESMTRLHDRFATGQTELMKALMTGGAGGGGGGGFQSGVNFALKFLAENRDKLVGAVQESGGDEETLLETLNNVFAGVQMFGQMQQQQQQGQPGYVPGNVPPGHAARANGAAPPEDEDDELDPSELPDTPPL